MSDAVGTADAVADGALAELEAAATELRRRRQAVADIDQEADVDDVMSVYRRLDRLMSDFRERATDWDDFQGYVEFRREFSNAVDEVPSKFAFPNAVDDADGHLKTDARSVLSDDDFHAAREALAPLREVVDALGALGDARDRYRDARRSVREARDDSEERIGELERLRALGEADLDAPVERLRDPIERHDAAAEEAFRTLYRDRPAREALSVVAVAARDFPLVPFEAPPDRLRSYLASDEDAGAVSVATLLTYCDHSRSKLAHHVDDADEFRTAVATDRTYLRRLSADPLLVGWPPPPAGVLRFRSREVVAVLGRFADESTVAAAREVGRLAERDDYTRLREAAVSRAELSDAERERAAGDDLDDDLRTARRNRERLADALDEHPPLSAFDPPR